MKRILAILLLAFLPLTPVQALVSGAIVWIDEGVSLQGWNHVQLQPVSNDTDQTFETPVETLILDTLNEKLIEAGVALVTDDGTPLQKTVRLSTSLVHFEPGTVGGRWFGMGSGAAVCIIRVKLADPHTEQLLGEMVSANQIEVGGLFSIGADKSVARNVAREIAEALVTLMQGGKE